MSRSGYSEDYDQWAMIRWRGAVRSSVRGERGQSFLRELAAALDAMPEKKLISSALVDQDGCFCTLGVVGHARGLDLKEIDPYDTDTVAHRFGVATALAREIVYMNDEYGWGTETPEARWSRMRQWVEAQTIKAPCDEQVPA